MSREGNSREERFLSPLQVAKRYGLTVAWVYRCKGLNKIKIRLGRYIRYRESDLEKFEEQTSTKGRGFDLQHRSDFIRRKCTQERKDRISHNLKTFKKRLRFDIE